MPKLRFFQRWPVLQICISAVLFAAIVIVAYAQNPAITISIDANANRHSINPNVYGMATPDAAALADLQIPVQRYGGNNSSRYNWQINGDNKDNDWYFESIGDDNPTPAFRVDSFVSTGQASGAQSLVTIPMIGWVAKLGPDRAKLSSFSIAKYGAQTGNDWQWFPDAGNGVLTNGQNVTSNDPNDADVPADSTFQQGLVQHEVTTFGPESKGGLRYYILDNEPSIWFATHRDVHPVGPTMDEIESKIVEYSAMIKGVDPTALIVGPEEWGWSGYFYSGYDQQYGSEHGWSNLPDRANHGGQDYLPWLLTQLRQNDTTTGKRTLDVFSVHYYPQSGEFSDDTSQATDLLRNRSTRSLWDPNYVDQSWIDDTVELIPRLKTWVNTYYPGTLTAVTEYNWGAEADINGATAQADILGIFGREGLDMATRWTTPDSSTPTYNAVKMYRNYDGQKSSFGDTSVLDTVPNPDNLSSFAAVRSSDGALTIMLVNKVLSGNTPATVNLANFVGTGQAQVWQLTSANTINHLPNLNYSGTSLALTLPQQSITLLVLPPGTVKPKPPVAVIKASPSSGPAPLAVAFSGTGSTDPNGKITSYAWNFGDGKSGSGSAATHTYSSPGTYTAMLTVADESGGSATANVSISVSAAPPAAPSVLTAAAKSTTVTLKWKNNSTSQSGVYIERELSSGGSYARVGQVSGTNSTFSQTVTKGKYNYRVQAFGVTGVASGYSNAVTIKVD
jgi:PKD repeat protein